MARIRTIKPEFFTSEDIVSLSPLARLLYIAMWCESDKEGRLVWKPRTFKLRYLPGDKCDPEAICQEIVDAGLVVLYGDGFAYIPSFCRHQHINPRESASLLPDPKECDASPRVATRQDASIQELTDREEGKGREGISKPSASHPPGGGPADGFSDFWEAWPVGERKQDKAKCLDLWKRQRLFAIAHQIVGDVRLKRGTQKWRDGFVEAPLVYLRGKRWEDGVTPEVPPAEAAAKAAAEQSQAYLREQAAHKAVPPPAEVLAKLRSVVRVVS